MAQFRDRLFCMPSGTHVLVDTKVLVLRLAELASLDDELRSEEQTLKNQQVPCVAPWPPVAAGNLEWLVDSELVRLEASLPDKKI